MKPASPHWKVRAAAFTVIEALAAFGLLALLAVFLFPVFKGAREQTRAAQCVSNLRVLGSAVLLHAGENHGKSVVSYLDPTLSPTGQGLLWHVDLQRLGYLPASSGSLVCPSENPFKLNNTVDAGMYTYGMRRWNSDRPYYSPAYERARTPNPSRYLLLADSFKPALNRQFYYITRTSNNYGPEQIHARHNKRAHIFLADGSVRAMNKQEIVDLQDGWFPAVIRESSF